MKERAEAESASVLPANSVERVEETLTFIAGEYSAAPEREKTGRNIIILHHSHSQGVEKNAFASAAD